MELSICKEQKKYFFAREMHGLVEENGEKLWVEIIFFEVPENVILKAKEIIRNNKNFNSEKWFVGIHLRTSNDDRKLQKCKFGKYFSNM